MGLHRSLDAPERETIRIADKQGARKKVTLKKMPIQPQREPTDLYKAHLIFKFYQLSEYLIGLHCDFKEMAVKKKEIDIW